MIVGISGGTSGTIFKVAARVMSIKCDSTLIDVSLFMSTSSARLDKSPPRSFSKEDHASQKTAYAAPERAGMAKPYFDSQYCSDWQFRTWTV